MSLLTLSIANPSSFNLEAQVQILYSPLGKKENPLINWGVFYL